MTTASGTTVDPAATSARRDGGAVRREPERRTEREPDPSSLRLASPSNLIDARGPALVPAHPPLVHAPPLVVSPLARQAAARDPEPALAEDTAGEHGGEQVTPGAAAVPPPPPGSIGARVQRTSLPELFLAMTTPDRGEDGGLLVDDDTDTLTTGQIRKRDFMRQLRAEVRRVAEDELARVGRSAAGCPYIDEMLGRYEGRTAAEVERAVRRYAPEARDVRDARDYIPHVTDRLARGIRQWAATGRMPEDAPGDEVQALGRARGWVGAFAGLAGIPPPPEPRQESAGGSGSGSQAAPQRKPLGPSPGRVDAGALVAQLGPGRPLDPAIRGRMEASFGHSFAAVRLHADDRAAGLAGDLAARAFTIGPHVALGAGAPAAGTLEGDALLAHELAHVVQQGTGAPTGDVAVGEAGDPLERDADAAAAQVMRSLHGGTEPAPRARPALHGGGLALRRCGAAQRQAPQHPPAPDPVFDTYRSAVERLRTTAADAYTYLANAPLATASDAFQHIRTVPIAVGGGLPPLEVRFDLRVELVEQMEGTDLAKFRNPRGDQVRRQLDLQHPPLFVQYPLRIEVSRRAAASVDDLTANLYHETIHMLLWMDEQIAASAQLLGAAAPAGALSPFQASYASYLQTARALPEYQAARTRFGEAIAGGGAPTPEQLATADGHLTTILQEKFAYDTTGRQYGERYHNSNAQIASDYVGDIFRDAGLAVSADLQRRTVAAVGALLDALDGANRGAAAGPTQGQPDQPTAQPQPVGPRLQRTSLPELIFAIVTPDRGEDGGLLVDDDTPSLTSGQMRKTEFLRELSAEVERAADAELARFGRTSADCPYLADMFARYETRRAVEVERAVRRYAPEARDVRHARNYIPYVGQRIARGVRRWITGQVPDDVPAEELGAMRRAGGSLTVPGRGAAPGPIPQRQALGPSSGEVDAGALVRELGPGGPLDGAVRGRMERAFGHSFAAVRVHTGDRAAELSRDLAARAFTIGPHIAFGAGAPAAGSAAGDALLAHELAHVVQQGTAAPTGRAPIGAAGDALERDADRAAAAVVAGRDVATARRSGAGARRSGLRLSRCGDVVNPEPRPADERAGTHLPTTTQQCNMLAAMGLLSASDVAACSPPRRPAAQQPGQARAEPEVQLSERAQAAARRWDGDPAEPNWQANRTALQRLFFERIDAWMAAHRADFDRLRREDQHRAPLDRFEGAAQAAQLVVDRYYAPWIANAVRTPGDLARRAAFRYRATGLGRNIYDAANLADLQRFHVPITAEYRILRILQYTDEGPSAEDRALLDHGFNRARVAADGTSPEGDWFADQIQGEYLRQHPDARAPLELYSRLAIFRAPPGNLMIQTYIPDSDQEQELLGRWSVFRTAVHEYIHLLAHPRFTRAIQRNSEIANEGFTEMFTRELLEPMLPSHVPDDAKQLVERGISRPWGVRDENIVGTYRSGQYAGYLRTAEGIRNSLGGPPRSLGRCSDSVRDPAGFNAVKAAYFQGHVELIGLSPTGGMGPQRAFPDEVAVPEGVTTFAELSRASGLTTAEIAAANPRVIDGALPARMRLPGCREHVVAGYNRTERDRPRAGQPPPPPRQETAVETPELIARQHGITVEQLRTANPGITARNGWSTLASDTTHLLIPRH